MNTIKLKVSSIIQATQEPVIFYEGDYLYKDDELCIDVAKKYYPDFFELYGYGKYTGDKEQDLRVSSFLKIDEKQFPFNLPFCYVDKKVEWHVPFESLKFSDLINTYYSTSDFEIVIYISGYGSAFFSDYIDYALIASILSYVANAYAVYDLVNKCRKKVKNYFKNKKSRNISELVETDAIPIMTKVLDTPNMTFHEFASAIENRKSWTTPEFAKYFECTEALANHILVQFGYEPYIKGVYILNNELNTKFHDEINKIKDQSSKDNQDD